MQSGQVFNTEEDCIKEMGSGDYLFLSNTHTTQQLG